VWRDGASGGEDGLSQRASVALRAGWRQAGQGIGHGRAKKARMRSKLVLTLAVTIAALAAAPAALADGLGPRDKAVMELRVWTKHAVCADCDQAPRMDRAVWRFASSYGPRNRTSFAYATVSWRLYNGKPGGAVLFGFDPYRGGWMELGFSAASRAGKPAFSCGADALINANYRLAQQVALMKRVASCS
jgi:hypothetical protein